MFEEQQETGAYFTWPNKQNTHVTAQCVSLKLWVAVWICDSLRSSEKAAVVLVMDQL